MKKAILISVILITAFVIADYCGLFLSINVDGARPIPVHFKVLDQSSGKPLTDVTIKALREGHEIGAIIKQKETSTDGIVHGLVMIGWGCKRTILFEKPNFLLSQRNKNMEFRFIHPSYQTETKTFLVKELRKTQTVELTPIANAK